MRKSLLAAVVLTASLVAAACDPSSPAGVAADARLSGGSGNSSGGTPVFLEAQPGTADTGPVSFYAKAGDDRMGEIFVNGSSGGNGDRIVRLRIRKSAEIILPNGSKLAKGDSVLITMQVTDTVTLATHFEPAGIQFKGKQAAVLTMWYGHTNAASTGNSGSLNIWKQETATAPWTKLASSVDPLLTEVTAYIPGFTNYVIAY